MTFGWQGFQFDHPEDWVPAVVSGTFREGYARIDSTSRMALQVRWQKGKGGHLNSVLDSYFKRLQHDAKRAGENFQSERRTEGDEIRYRWLGFGQGRGSIFVSGESIYMLEVIGNRSDGLLPHLKAALASFSHSPLWSVLGLRLSLPPTFRLEKHEFKAGKTSLWFTGASSKLECIRWGFAEQLLQRYSLGDWAKAALGIKSASIADEAPGVRLSASSVLVKKEALVRLDSEHNQIITVSAAYMKDKGRPSWDWLI